MTTGVAGRLDSIRDRIERACSIAGRDPGEVTLLGAAKRQPGERILAAAGAGLADFGENIVQEAEAHASLLSGFDVRWHLIGPLQSNKARKAARLFDWIHSIDRMKIARRLDRECRSIDRVLTGLIEVNLGAEKSKHGFAPQELPAFADELFGLDSLRIAGLMAIPPVSSTSDETRAWFRQLRELKDRLFASGAPEHPGFLSMGMSADFEIAIEEGATHIRIGTELFGARAPRH
ncbi:MAG: YggS family pyridoxal phosphate-dependent enzyme [Thermoanaerobaculia bacterium]